MNNHNQHNKNTPNTPQADASQLSDEQQALLTAESLGQLDSGSSEAAKAAEVRTGQHHSEAEQLAAGTTKIYQTSHRLMHHNSVKNSRLCSRLSPWDSSTLARRKLRKLRKCARANIAPKPTNWVRKHTK